MERDDYVPWTPRVVDLANASRKLFGQHVTFKKTHCLSRSPVHRSSGECDCFVFECEPEDLEFHTFWVLLQKWFNVSTVKVSHIHVNDRSIWHHANLEGADENVITDLFQMGLVPDANSFVNGFLYAPDPLWDKLVSGVDDVSRLVNRSTLNLFYQAICQKRHRTALRFIRLGFPLRMRELRAFVPGIGHSLINEAIRTSTPSLVKELLERDADPNETKDNMTPLCTAMCHCETFSAMRDTVKLLLQYGADPTKLTAEPKQHLRVSTHLEVAIVKNVDERVIRMLLEHGLDPQQRDGLGQTLWHFVAFHATTTSASFPFVKDLLLEANVCINSVDNSGHTALSYCIDHARFCELVECGASPHLLNTDTFRFASFAEYHRKYDILYELLKHNVDLPMYVSNLLRSYLEGDHRKEFASTLKALDTKAFHGCTDPVVRFEEELDRWEMHRAMSTFVLGTRRRRLASPSADTNTSSCAIERFASDVLFDANLLGNIADCFRTTTQKRVIVRRPAGEN